MSRSNESILSKELIETVKSQLVIDWTGIHGMSHWARVYDYGSHIAKLNGANLKVVHLFALFHDSRRFSEGSDPHHGYRATELVQSLHGKLFKLKHDELDLLLEACRFHTSATDHENITIKTCFDADRLDLGRVGIEPDQLLLCTAEAKKAETISWAYRQSISNELPDNVLTRNYLNNSQ